MQRVFKNLHSTAYYRNIKRGSNKSPRRQNPKVFNTLFLGKNKLKHRNYIRTKLRLEELNKREKPDSETLTSTSRELPGLELRIPTRAKQVSDQNNWAT